SGAVPAAGPEGVTVPRPRPPVAQIAGWRRGPPQKRSGSLSSVYPDERLYTPLRRDRRFIGGRHGGWSFREAGLHIADIMQQRQVSCSFEFCPPRSEEAAEDLYRSIGGLEQRRPSFVSVTYGAGGGTRQLTNDLVLRIKRET